MREASVVDVSRYIIEKALGTERHGRAYISDDNIIHNMPFVTKEWLEEHIDMIILDLILSEEVVEAYHEYSEVYNWSYFDVLVWDGGVRACSY